MTGENSWETMTKDRGEVGERAEENFFLENLVMCPQVARDHGYKKLLYYVLQLVRFLTHNVNARLIYTPHDTCNELKVNVVDRLNQLDYMLWFHRVSYFPRNFFKLLSIMLKKIVFNSLGIIFVPWQIVHIQNGSGKQRN